MYTLIEREHAPLNDFAYTLIEREHALNDFVYTLIETAQSP